MLTLNATKRQNHILPKFLRVHQYNQNSPKNNPHRHFSMDCIQRFAQCPLLPIWLNRAIREMRKGTQFTGLEDFVETKACGTRFPFGRRLPC